MIKKLITQLWGQIKPIKSIKSIESPILLEQKYEQAVTLHSAGQLNAAQQQYQILLEYEPRHAKALAMLGTIQLQSGNFEAALEYIEQSLAIEPNQPETYCNKGFALTMLQRLDEALLSYEYAIKLKPDFAEAYNNHGNLLKSQGKLQEAVLSYERAISLNPNFAMAHNSYGAVLKELNRFEEALLHYHRAIELLPNYAEAYYNRGFVQQQLNHFEDALGSYNHAIQLKKDDAETYYNRGFVQQKLNHFEDALESYNHAIQLKKDFLAAYNNKGIILAESHRFNEALNNCDEAIKQNSNSIDAYFFKSTLLLLQCQYKEGWELYEYRCHLEHLKHYYIKYNKKPWWKGQESLHKKTLLVYSEQGFGDTIQFCRYLPQIEKKYNGVSIIFIVQDKLVSLIKTLKSNAVILSNTTEERHLSYFDFQCYLMSLPLALKTTEDNIISAPFYLFSEIEKIAIWKERVGVKKKLRIGLAWAGFLGHVNDHNRSLRLEQLAPIFELPFEFHSLQVDMRDSDEITFNSVSHIRNHATGLHDFSDTAALVEQMDIIISVDTSVAHLSAALGKKVFILLPYFPDYRWMLNRSDSPWYPSVTLLRQTKRGDWDSVIRNMKNILIHNYM
ncbi:MAG: hypothetical protein RIR79_1432 [Pseudomonadota bacterium]|jgi:tetratricopeptide (TPR) repeat protein